MLSVPEVPGVCTDTKAGRPRFCRSCQILPPDSDSHRTPWPDQEASPVSPAALDHRLEQLHLEAGADGEQIHVIHA